MNKEVQNLLLILDSKLEYMYNNIKELKEHKDKAHEDFERRLKFLEAKYYIMLGFCFTVSAVLPFIIHMLLKVIN